MYWNRKCAACQSLGTSVIKVKNSCIFFHVKFVTTNLICWICLEILVLNASLVDRRHRRGKHLKYLWRLSQMFEMFVEATQMFEMFLEDEQMFEMFMDGKPMSNWASPHGLPVCCFNQERVRMFGRKIWSTANVWSNRPTHSTNQNGAGGTFGLVEHLGWWNIWAGATFGLVEYLGTHHLWERKTSLHCKRICSNGCGHLDLLSLFLVIRNTVGGEGTINLGLMPFVPKFSALIMKAMIWTMIRGVGNFNSGSYLLYVHNPPSLLE